MLNLEEKGFFNFGSGLDPVFAHFYNLAKFLLSLFLEFLQAINHFQTVLGSRLQRLQLVLNVLFSQRHGRLKLPEYILGNFALPFWRMIGAFNLSAHRKSLLKYIQVLSELIYVVFGHRVAFIP